MRKSRCSEFFFRRSAGGGGGAEVVYSRLSAASTALCMQHRILNEINQVKFALFAGLAWYHRNQIAYAVVIYTRAHCVCVCVRMCSTLGHKLQKRKCSLFVN